MLGRAVVYPGSKGRMWSKKKYSAAGVGVVVRQCAVTVDKKKYSFVMDKKVLMIGWTMTNRSEKNGIKEDRKNMEEKWKWIRCINFGGFVIFINTEHENKWLLEDQKYLIWGNFAFIFKTRK